MRLTDIQVRNLKAPEKGAHVYYDDALKGFGVRVSQAGTKAFVLATGKNRDRVTIGRYPNVSLHDARKEAQRLIGERASGTIKPPKARMIFSDALTLFVAEKSQKNRARTIDENKRILTKYFPKLQTKALSDITTDDITTTLDKLSETPGTSLHAFWSMRLFMRWCVKRRYIQHNPIEGLDAPAPTNRRDRVLSDDELRAVWKAADEMSYPFGCVVKLLIITGARRSEIGTLSIGWLDFEKQTCTIPSEYSKNRKSHQFPIGTTAICILKFAIASAHQNEGTYLFPAQGRTNSCFSGWSKAKIQIDKLAKIEPWTLHDLRRTLATNWQRLGIRYEVIESYLNHISGTKSGVAGTYQRHRYEAEMREAVTAYENWFTATIAQP